MRLLALLHERRAQRLQGEEGGRGGAVSAPRGPTCATLSINDGNMTRIYTIHIHYIYTNIINYMDTYGNIYNYIEYI